MDREDLGARLGLRIKDPLHSDRPKMTTEMIFVYCVMLWVIHLFIMVPAALLISRDSRVGIIERWLVAGANSKEVFVSRLASQFCVMLIQITSVLAFWYAFMAGAFEALRAAVVPLVFLQGLQALSQGLVFGSLFTNPLAVVTYTAIASLFAFLATGAYVSPPK